MPAEITAREQIYTGKVVTLELVTLQLPDGRSARQEVIIHRPSVGMVPVDEQGRLLLVRQYRSPASSDLLEIPAGSVDPEEDVETAVQRELQEEVGMRAGRLRRLGGFYLAPGYCSEYMHVYVADGLTSSVLQADEDELIDVERLTLHEALSQIEAGEIQDVKSIAALLLYARELAR